MSCLRRADDSSDRKTREPCGESILRMLPLSRVQGNRVQSVAISVAARVCEKRCLSGACACIPRDACAICLSMRATLTTVVSALLRFLGLPLRQGRWTRGSAYSARGLLAIAPLVAPRREYLVYEPRGYTRWRRSPLIVLCHGCRQTPEDFAQGTRIAAAADAIRVPCAKSSGVCLQPWHSTISG